MSAQPQANRKFWRNAQGCAEAVKAQKWQLGGDSMCLGSSWCKSVMAWGSAVGVTQRFHPLRPEDSVSLALQSALTHQAHSGEGTKQGGVLISYLCEHQVLVTRLVCLTRLMSEKAG